MKMSRNEFLGLSAIITIGVLAYDTYKTRKALKEKEQQYTVDLENGVEEIKTEVKNHVHDQLIEEAIKKAVDAKVDDILKEAKSESVKAARDTISSTCMVAVNTTWNSLKSDISNELVAKAGKLDVEEIREDATRKLREKASRDVDEKLDQMIDDIRDKADKRVDAAVKRAESKIDKRSTDLMSDLKSTYDFAKKIALM